MFRWVVCVAAALWIGTVGLHAADGEGAGDAKIVDAGTANPIVITATRGEKPAFDTPYSLGIVGADDLAGRQIKQTPDALREIPGLMIQKTSPGQGSPFIRGITGFRNLFLIDGIRLNNSTFRAGPIQFWNTVDPYSIDSFEVVKGPSSVLYGSDAVGGTVNARTISPFDFGQGTSFFGKGLYRIASAEDSHIARAEVGATIDDKFGVLFGATGKWFGTLRAGSGEKPNTGYDEWDVDFKTEYFFTPDTQLVFAYQQVQQNNVPRTHSTVFSESFSGTTVGSDLQRDLDMDRRLIYAQLHADNIGGAIESFSASLSWHEQVDTQDRIRGSGRRDLQARQIGTIGLSAQATSDTSIGLLTYGFEFYHDNVNSSETRQNLGGPVVPQIQGPVADDASYDIIGLFLQDEIKLTDQLDLILGGRFTYARAQADRALDQATSGVRTIDEDFTGVVGSIRGVYHLVPEHVNIYGGVSQGFRAPNLHDLSANVSQRTNTVAVGAENLDEENYIQFEIGTKMRDEGFAAEAAYFYTIVSDSIVDAPTGAIAPGGETIISRVNAGDGYYQGIELAASYRVCPQVTLFGNVAWVEGELDTFLDLSDPTSLVSGYASRVQPITGLLGVRLDDANNQWWVEGAALLADRADKLAPGDLGDTQRIPPGGTPGYAVFSVRSGIEVTADVTVFLAIENILDKDYRVHGSGTNEVGRNFVLGLEFRF